MKTCWPNEIQCGVAVTFDIDAETFWLSRNPDSQNNPGIMSEGAYGSKVGVPRILRMLETLRIKATFFVPVWVIERYTVLIREIVSAGHEIGYHGYLHEVPSTLEEEEELIVKCKKNIEDLLSVTPKGYRAPEWNLRFGFAELLGEYGFEYSSNLMDADRPYLHVIENGQSIVELPTSWLFDDSTHFFFTYQHPSRVRPVAPPSIVKEIWLTEFEGIYEEGGSMVLTLHPQIIGRSSRVRMLEEILTYMKHKPGTLISMGIEVANAARKGLEER